MRWPFLYKQLVMLNNLRHFYVKEAPLMNVSTGKFFQSSTTWLAIFNIFWSIMANFYGSISSMKLYRTIAPTLGCLKFHYGVIILKITLPVQCFFVIHSGYVILPNIPATTKNPTRSYNRVHQLLGRSLSRCLPERLQCQQIAVAKGKCSISNKVSAFASFGEAKAALMSTATIWFRLVLTISAKIR